MSQETTDNFWRAIRDFRWPEIQPVSYRLYHDDQGRPLFYTMEHLPGTYIEVDQATYISSPFNVRVRDGKLNILAKKTLIAKLRPDPAAGTCCHVADICIVVDADSPHQYWSKQTNEID